jgi:hypothetical protein
MPRGLGTAHPARDEGAPLIRTADGLADVSEIRRGTPLPETADELCAVAHYFGIDSYEVRLGNRATEREVKRMSRAGELAQGR